jgi:hypothetical protein
MASRVTLELTNRADLGSDWTLAKCLLAQSG